MEITRRNLCLHDEFENGEVTFGVHLSTDTSNEELETAIYKWADGIEDVELNFRFTLSDCIEDMIEWHSTGDVQDVAMEERHRPMIEALKSELSALAARLDEIQFKPNRHGVAQPEE